MNWLTRLFQKQSSQIDLHAITVSHGLPGPRLVITAGMDGDEYAGIEAAYRLSEQYRKIKFYGIITIIPIVNLPGFQNEVSWNPIDRKYLKRCFPGSSTGSDTERRIHALYNQYIYPSTMWIDLHDGSLTESLLPFVWLYKTKYAAIDIWTESLIKQLRSDHILYKPITYERAMQALARKGIRYMLTESGSNGGHTEVAVARHIQWVETTMRHLHMLPEQVVPKSSQTAVYTDLIFVTARSEGVWRIDDLEDTIAVKQRIGEIAAYDGKRRIVYAAASGRVLWKKTGLHVKIGDVLAAIASF